MPPAKLCCTAEQRSGSSSPDLPNARLSNATPAKRLLFETTGDSQLSQVTSTRSEDMHELQQIFNGATDGGSSPTRSGFHIRKSMSTPTGNKVHKIKSVGALIKKRLSRDLSRSRSKSSLPSVSGKGAKGDENDAQGTVVKSAVSGANLEVKITKEDLKKNLLSSRSPDEGGYDDDALELDDVVRKLGRKTPTRRLSIHSVEWTTPTTGNSTRHRQSCSVEPGSQPYQISKYTLPSSLPTFPSVPQLPSSPSLRVKWMLKARQLRRSQSASSIEMLLPKLKPLEPIRLPSISSLEATPWSLSMAESLQLSEFPSPPAESKSTGLGLRSISLHERSLSVPSRSPSKRGQTHQSTTLGGLKRSVTDTVHQEPIRALTERETVSRNRNDEDDSRKSVHLYDMRISRHLRSASLLSSVASMNSPQHARTPTPTKRGERKTSSGLDSTNIPAAWGNVIKSDEPGHHDESSSIYSSRPQSPHDSVKEPAVNLRAVAQAGKAVSIIKKPSALISEYTSTGLNISPPRDRVPSIGTSVLKPGNLASGSFRPSIDPFITITNIDEDAKATDTLLAQKPPFISASANSSQTSLSKKSRFLENFSPASSQKKASKTLSAVSKFLLTRGNSVIGRSQSISALRGGDGPSDEIDRHIAVNPNKADKKRERRLSRSMISLKNEQQPLAQHQHDASPMWERALKQYQEERSVMFLSPDRSTAPAGNPFRERSNSCSRRLSVSTSSRTNPSLSSTVEEDTPVDLSLTPGSPGHSPALIPVHSQSSGVSGAVSEADWDRVGQEGFKKRVFEGSESKAALGAWGQYPSHTREMRGGSAGPDDRVFPRDFALQPPNPASQMKKPSRSATMFNVQNVFSTASPSKSGLGDVQRSEISKRKAKLAKSHSMTFGKTFLKNYGRLFRSSSSEFRKFGHGHRSSVAEGGVLEYPELEMLPEVFLGHHVQQQRARSAADAIEMQVLDEDQTRDTDADTVIITEPTEDGDSADGDGIDGDGRLDGAADVPLPPPTPAEHPDEAVPAGKSDSAHNWSCFYASCVEYPLDDVRAELAASSGELAPSESRRYASETALSLPLRFSEAEGPKGGRRSCSAFVYKMGPRMGREGGGSACSVRKSTADLVSGFLEAERVERERVLALDGAGVAGEGAMGMRVRVPCLGG
ncbi:uncharacterized protein BDZ99DRAFT_531730 [Mytilinidion resinicola]|uniref:Uncharacterized protein n=1 Tax=Mytilinidion resinicola TaxID=574789 RepID=A0A6A6YNI7_9PEZI|nr:uncharacterized protein BDZ99DRAFT_531730 [Mytilinidion resinicola]KAF2809427.1 hypothetical protein BDZ99DRAFT_531730 [Mytilinidion resinicola]